MIDKNQSKNKTDRLINKTLYYELDEILATIFMRHYVIIIAQTKFCLIDTHRLC